MSELCLEHHRVDDGLGRKVVVRIHVGLADERVGGEPDDPGGARAGELGEVDTRGDPDGDRDETKATLMQIAPTEGEEFGYEYDFGDSWEHAIKVEKIFPHASDASTIALCLDGARACPPEDCGGFSGYADLLKILKNRKHPEHKEMKEWIGDEFNADSFDISKINTLLRKLKWPRVTEAQLRKVLMARDNYREE